MPIAVHHEGGPLLRVEMRGVLRKIDLERTQNDLLAHAARVGRVKLLFVLEGFEGWHPGDHWSDLSFYIMHGDTIERIAIVADERWRSETLMFAGADLRKAPVHFFPTPAIADARAWLAD